MKDSIMPGLLSKEQSMGGEVSCSGGQVVPSTVGQTKVYMPVGGDIGTNKKGHLWPRIQNKKGSY